jgi:hypothetical protein
MRRRSRAVICRAHRSHRDVTRVAVSITRSKARSRVRSDYSWPAMVMPVALASETLLLLQL